MQRQEILHRHDRIPHGWSVDGDGWLVRRVGSGEAAEKFWTGAMRNNGFVWGGSVYAREVEHAQAFDARRVGRAGMGEG